MRAWFVLLARFCLAAWVGAAVLFVIVAVREVRHPSFNSLTRDHLALVRFPAYYVCGFALLTAALIGSLSAIGHPAVGRHRGGSVSALVGLALILLAVDYLFIYTPLAQMTTPPGGAKPAQFVTYHRLSMWINTAGVGVSLIAAWIVNWPGKAEGLQSLGLGPDDLTRRGRTGA